MKRHFVAAVVATVSMVCAGSASAATFEGDFYGFFRGIANDDDDVSVNGWANPPGSGNHGYRGLSWGYTDNSDDDTSDTSHLHINDTAFSCALGSGITDCDVGTISYYNARSYGPTNDEDFNAQMRLYVDIDKPSDLPRAGDHVNLNLRSTVNQATPATNPANNDFILAADWDQFFSTNLDLGGGYTLLGYLLSVDNGSLTFPTDTTFDWVNSEGHTSVLTLTAQIEGPSEVPLPAAGWLLVAGLGGLAAFKRAHKKD